MNLTEREDNLMRLRFNHLLFFSSLHLFALTQFAGAALPAWVKSASKIGAYEEFVEGMRAQEFYRITNLETSVLHAGTSDEAIGVKITFDDDQGCKGRTQVSSCTPLYQNEIICNHRLSYCKPNQHGMKDATEIVETRQVR